MGIELTSEQRELQKELKHWWDEKQRQIFVYSGRAGTGKTTMVKLFIEEMGLELKDVVCCALAGKAVTVLASHGLQAKTIHSLIYRPTLTDVLDENGEKVLKENGEPKKKLSFVKKENLDYDYKLIVIDELSMVNDEMMQDVLSFGVPVIGMGDLNQLPPIFGISSYMIHPNFVLTKIMRQAEGDPIVYLANRILDHLPISEGAYGRSNVLRKVELGRNLLTDYNITLCARNMTRDIFNDGVRYVLLKRKDRTPKFGDRVICRQNAWDRCLDGIYLTNGTTGTIVDIDEEHCTKNKLVVDFAPDYNPEMAFQGIEIDKSFIMGDYIYRKESGLTTNLKFEYSYMITTHLSQGSQYNSCLFIDEQFGGDRETRQKLRYTAITRAIKRIDIVTSSAFLSPWAYL
jgi:exodeoxyribonuclease-5